MFKNFEEFLSNNKVDESNDNRVIIKYRWLDYFKNQWYETKCEVISHTDKSAQIKLLEFGPRGSRPGRIMRVHLKSLVGFNDGKQKSKPDTSWRRYTDPDLYKDDDEVNESKTVIEESPKQRTLLNKQRNTLRTVIWKMQQKVGVRYTTCMTICTTKTHIQNKRGCNYSQISKTL